MDVYEYLWNVKRYERIKDDLQRQVEELRTLAEKTTPGNADGMPRGNAVSDKIGNLAAKIVDTEGEILDAIEKYIDYKKEVIINLKKLPTDQYEVLFKRYIEYKKCDTIAEEMFLSRQQVWRIQGKAYTNLKAIINS